MKLRPTASAPAEWIRSMSEGIVMPQILIQTGRCMSLGCLPQTMFACHSGRVAAWHPFQDWRRDAGTTRTNKFENPKLHKTSLDLRGVVQARVSHNARRVRDRMQPLSILP